MKDDFAINIKNVSKSFIVPTENKNSIKSYFLNPFHKVEKRRFKALNDISFAVKRGEVLGIIGANGSGKSTLLKLIASIYLPDHGSVKIDGNIIPFLELGVGFNLELSGRENIFLNGTILGMSKKYLKQRYQDIVDFSEIHEFIDMPMKNYSSGMQVRLAFSIAVQADADIYLLDEILAVGDANFQLKSFEKLKEIKKAKKTIILVSHDENSIREHCSKALYLSHGKVQYFGDVERALAEYNENNINQHARNITDTAAKVTKVKSEIRWGSGDYVIKDIIIKDAKEVQTVNFEYDSDIKIEIQFEKISEDIPSSLNVGVGIYNTKDDYVFGVNTQMDEQEIDREAKSVTLRIKNNRLLQGRYYLNVVIFGDEEKKAYDWIGKVKEFQVIKSPSHRGVVELDYQWETNK